NGTEIAGFTAGTTWEYSVTLNSGSNSFVFSSMDTAGNQSNNVTVEITYEDVPPLAVTTLTVNGEGSGTTAILDWTGYDENEHGDIASYSLYAETTNYSDVSTLTSKGTVTAGTFNQMLDGLDRGATYYFSVVAVDVNGNRDNNVTTVSAILSDIVPPEDPTGLNVECHETSLVFSWTASANTDNDLAGYKVYFNDDVTGVDIPASQTSYSIADLTPADSYPFKVAAYDNDNNESAGASLAGITLLNNPEGLIASSHSKRIHLEWQAINQAQAQYLKHYAVYISETDITTVDGLSPVLTTSNIYADVTGLTNGNIYYLAVTSVNQSDGENKTVTSVSEIPQNRMLAFYTMDNILDSTLVDEQGYIDGSINSEPLQEEGYSNNALAFDGSDDWIAINGLKNYPITGDDLSISLWFKTPAVKTGDNNNIIFSANRENKGDVFRLGTGNNGGIYYSSVSGDNEYGSGFNDNQWHHLVCVQYGNGNFAIYVDYILIQSGTKPVTTWSLAAYYSIGQEWDSNPSDFFTGSLDQVQIYNYALSTGEIDALFVDLIAPNLVATYPLNNASASSITYLKVRLKDIHGDVDDSSVIDSFELLDSQNQEITGSIVEYNDLFTFTPDTVPLPDDIYFVSFTASDTEGNAAVYEFRFYVDASAPVKPVITGGTVTSGTIGAQPAENSSDVTTITLTGTREEDTSVWVNNIRRKVIGSDDWSFNLTLNQGDNTLEVWLEDAAGNKSESEFVDILVDSVAPVVNSIDPTNNSLINASPTEITVNYTDASSGLDKDSSLLTIRDSSFTEIASNADWQLIGDDQIVYTPLSDLSEEEYTVQVQLIDNLGNEDSLKIYHFTVDTTPPVDPVITSPSISNNQTITVTGTKEIGSSILLDGVEIIGFTEASSWEYVLILTEGSNSFTFASKDEAGNQSADVPFDIQFEDVPPLAVTTLTVNGEGNGTTAVLNWSGYNESEHGDVASYRIYAETASYTDVTDLTAAQTVSSGTFTHTFSTLTRGATYYFAVVAVDTGNKAISTVNPVNTTLTDIVAPANPAGLTVNCFDTSLSFNWNAVADSDLAGYKVYFDGDTTGIDTGGDLSYTRDSLSTASQYSFRVTSVDNDGNESSGTTITGITLLDNPANLSSEPASGYIDLSWDAVGASEYLKNYNIYVSTGNFSSVEGMSPAVKSTSTTAKVAGLTNNTTYYFAVTSINLSNGEDKSVSTISDTPVPDTIGPDISNVLINGETLISGYSVTDSATITLEASDLSGVSRVEFSIDSVVFSTDYSGSSYYDAYWNIIDATDGAHTITVTAYDTVGNSSSLSYAVTVAMALPDAPVITQPLTGTETNQPTITVKGTSDKNTDVIVYNNSTQAGGPVSVGDTGKFTAAIQLTEGANSITAASVNRAGTGPLSSAVTVNLDTTIPSSPENAAARAKASGIITLSWRAPVETSVKGYNIYRSSGSFSDVSGATKINSSLITATSYNDLPPADGEYFYRLTLENSIGNVSALSEEVSAASDRTAPRIASIEYTPGGNYDPDTGRVSPGTLGIELTLSEPLMSAPFFSITPENGLPTSIDLIKVSDLTYTGIFSVTESTPSGTAYAVFSGRDVVGNRGTEINSGESILLDTKGPEVTSISIVPQDPIQNDESDPETISVTITLNEKIREGGVPELGYLLSGDGRDVIDIPAVSQVSDYVWEGSFTLPSDAGSEASGETFSFIYTGYDDLDNESDTVLCSNIFQLFQGDLPPLAVPENLEGTVLSEGRVNLIWSEVEGAAGYVLFRQAPGEENLTEYIRIESVTQFTDQTSVDGIHLYAVASIRQDSGLESVSGMSATAAVLSDSVAPGDPSGVALELVANGMKIEWIAPAYTEPITYKVYRANTAEITSVEGMTALIHSIPQTLVVDPDPASSGRAYAVTAVDAAGNESVPSSAYINPGLLPVSSLKVVQSGTNPPVLTWTHASQGSISGYDLYLGPEDSRIKINTDPITTTSYTDIGYSGDERIYTLVALDGVEESLPRSIKLPVLKAKLTTNDAQQTPGLRRGIMNKLEYQVENLGDSAVSNVSLRLNVEGKNHVSDSFSLEPGALSLAPVVVGGYDSLPDVADTTTTILVKPRAGEEIRIIRTSYIEVSHGMMILQLSNEEFTKGATGNVSFTLKNTGEEEIEIITATNKNNSPSNHIRYYLLDEDGNVIATAKFKQTIGDNIVSISTGETVARIPAGETFASGPLTINVPLNAPDNITILLDISKVYYHRGRSDQVVMEGLSGTHDISLVETSYYGVLDTVSPESSTGDEDIILSGRAIERSTGLLMPGIPLELVVTVKGFERRYDILTGSDGNFSHTFTPLSGESGVYTVRVVHPDRTDKPVHGQFVISRVSVSPALMNVALPYNFSKTLSVKVTTGDGTDVNNLHLAYDEADQPGGTYPQGVYLTPKSTVSYLAGNKRTYLNFTVWADNSAAGTSTVKLKVKSDESGDDSWGTVTVNMSFSEAQPVLKFSPSHIETGVGFDDTITESITLKNSGLGPMNDVSLSLRKTDGTAAPGWLYFTSASELGDIAVGESKKVNISFSPTAAQVSEGVHSLKLRVTSSNYNTTNINIYVSVTQAGEGDVLFKISDIYTGTPDSSNNIIQGLKNAKIYVQNEEVLTIDQTKTTDSLGEAYFSGLPAGRYKCRVTANNHQEYIGRLWVKPGIAVNEEVFLEYNLVTVEWSVTETTIEDKYEIVLNAVYETNVPAAVVVASPSSVNLPVMKKGDVYNGEFTLTNYGLIRADNINLALPQSDAFFVYEILGGMPASIEAKESITVPYRVTALQSPSGEDGGTGGGCERYLKCVRTDYEYEASCGKISKGSTKHCVIYDNGECTSTPGVPTSSGGSSGVWNIGTSTGSGSVSTPAPKPSSIQGVKCFPDAPRGENCGDDCSDPGNDKYSEQDQETGSSVSLIHREYNLKATDISVKVPGGFAGIQRRYYDGKWQWEHERNNLTPEMDSLGTYVSAFKKGGVRYGGGTSTTSTVFKHKSYSIIRSSSDYKWKDKRGNWKQYNSDGKIISEGSRNGIIVKYLYETEKDGKLIGILDKNDNQVLWLEYTDDELTSVKDAENRTVVYGYTNGNLTTVTNLLGKDTKYQYDSKNRLVKKFDPKNNVTNIGYDSYGNVASVKDGNGIGYEFEFDYDSGKKEAYARVKSTSGMIKEVWFDRYYETKRVDINGRTVKKVEKDGSDKISIKTISSSTESSGTSTIKFSTIAGTTGEDINVTDERGNITRKEFDEWDNLTKVIYPDGSSVSYEYEHTFNRKIKEVNER
ncbi:MAG: fibronectin type III domain-containing protein, partial [Desulfobacteraceae bacterium]